MVSPPDLRSLAAAVRDCSVDGSPMVCRLDSILHALYIVAIVLAGILIAVIVMAVRFARRKEKDRSDLL